MTPTDWIQAAAAIGGLALAGWQYWRATLAESRARRAEAELELALNRVAGPWFEIAEIRNRPLQVSTYRVLIGEGLGMPRLCKLMGEKREVPKGTELGTPVLLVVANIGKAAASLDQPTLDGEPILLQQESAMTSEPDPIMKATSTTEATGWPLWWFEYPYNPERHGAKQELILEFIDSGGFKRRHVYCLTHGFAELRRTEPPS